MAVYVENANFIPDPSWACGILRTDDLVYHTVKSINTAATAKIFPLASDTTNAGLVTYSGTQARTYATDAVQAVKKATANDLSIRKNLNNPQ